jgi:hypothetical protein
MIIFYVHCCQFPSKVGQIFLKNAQMLEIGLFTKMFLTSAKDNQIKIISQQELYGTVHFNNYIISLFIIGH